MNSYNHFLFSLSLCLLLLPPTPANAVLAVLFSLVFGVLIDLDHVVNKRAPWYHKRTWLQEPLGLIIVGLPLALVLSLVIEERLALLILVPYSSHILLDYLCVFEARPLAPFLSLKKKEGWGLFIPDDPFVKTENSKRWARRVREKGIRGISENYFTVFNLLLLVLVIVVRYTPL